MRLRRHVKAGEHRLDDTENPYLVRGKREESLATWWIQATPGTTYWRCLLPARHLPGQALPFSYDSLAQDKDGVPYLNGQRGSTAVWQFLGDEKRSRVALGIKQQTGIRTLMELDDNYTRVPPYTYGKVSPWSKTRAEAIELEKRGGTGYSHEMHRMVVPFMDGLIASTEYLADVYSELHDEIYVCPNSVDPDDWQYEREPHDAFRIVYYGSPSHGVDTPLVTDALKWAAKQEGVEVWTAGFKNPAWSFPHQVVPWAKDLADARKNLFSFDVGIAPLKANPWSNCKSDVKALEYAMAGVMPILQDAEPYRPFKEQAGWQWMCKTKGDWMEAIQDAVRLGKEGVALEAQVAKEYVLYQRTIQDSIRLWRDALHV